MYLNLLSRSAHFTHHCRKHLTSDLFSVAGQSVKLILKNLSPNPLHFRGDFAFSGSAGLSGAHRNHILTYVKYTDRLVGAVGSRAFSARIGLRTPLIPAQAGIQLFWLLMCLAHSKRWVPAFAGTNGEKRRFNPIEICSRSRPRRLAHARVGDRCLASQCSKFAVDRSFVILQQKIPMGIDLAGKSGRNQYRGGVIVD